MIPLLGEPFLRAQWDAGFRAFTDGPEDMATIEAG